MEDIRRFERENTVDAANQLPNSERFFSDVGRGGLRVLFVGNSITLHAPKPAPKSHWLSGLSSFDSRRGCVSRGEGHSGITKT